MARRSASVGMLCVSSARVVAGRSPSSCERPRPRPSVGLQSNRARPCARVATAAAVGGDHHHSPALGPSHPPLEALLPPGHDLRDSYVPNRVADVSRYWAIPNLRPLRESSETILTVLKVSSALILAASMGTVVYHNVQLAAEERAGGRVADVSEDVACIENPQVTVRHSSAGLGSGPTPASLSHRSRVKRFSVP